MRKRWSAAVPLMVALIIPLLPWRNATAGVPDPEHQLPAATTAQVPLTSAYNLLNVPGMAAGSFYLDPTTNVKIYKLTSASFPTTGYSWGHAYSEGGDEVSLPYSTGVNTPQTRTIHLDTVDGFHWLIDFNPGVGVTNWRKITTTKPFNETSFAFSNNSATPWYAYVGDSNGVISRMDIRTWTAADGNGWPITDDASHPPLWLHQSKNDGRFVWMRSNTNPTVIVGYYPNSDPNIATLRTYSASSINEPRIDRDGRYIGLSMNVPQNGMVLLDWGAPDPPVHTITTFTVAGSLDGTIPFAHIASLRSRWVGEDWNESYPPDFTVFTPGTPPTVVHSAGPGNASLFHGNGNWIQYPADLGDQWALVYHYGSLRPPESYWLAPGGMILITPNGLRRLLAHPYNTSSLYQDLSFAKFSPDGNYVLFTSNMNSATTACPDTACNTACWLGGTHYNAGTIAVKTARQPNGCGPAGSGGCLAQSCRSDVFLAELPTYATSTQNVTWISSVNATPTGNSLLKTGGCDGCADSGAVSQQAISSGDGYVQFTAGATNKTRFAGLANGNTDTTAADIRFSVALWDNALAYVYENGVYVTDIGTYAAGDLFKVSVEGGVVKYYQNGTLKYSHTPIPAVTYPLLMDTSLWSASSPINSAIISGAL
jgi:hypothetical protein